MDLTRKTTVNETAKRWKDQYFSFGVWSDVYSSPTRESAKVTYDALKQISDDNDLDAVDVIIGNNTWTHDLCSNCSKQTRETMVCFDVNGGEYVNLLCKKCLKKALKTLKEIDQ